jgi:hypothetical protein
VGAAPSLDGTRPVQVNSVRSMNAEQAIAVARLIEQRNVVEAVMALRAICNIGLAEARDVVQQFPVRGFPAELVPTAAAAANEARRQADARSSAAAPPPVIDLDDPEAASQEGDEEESNDAKHSLASVRAAIEQVRVEAKTVFDQALHAAGLQRAPEPERTPAPAASSGVAAAAQAPRVEPAATFPAPAAVAPGAAAASRRQRGATANAVVGLLRTKEGARQALLVSEILGPPRAVKPLR